MVAWGTVEERVAQARGSVDVVEKLDELLRFRHLFLTGYSLRLDALRLQLVARKALELKLIYRGQIDRFLEFPRRLE